MTRFSLHSVAGSVADMAERVRFELTDAETSAVFKPADGTLPRSQDSTPPHGTAHNFGSNFGSRPFVVHSQDAPPRIRGRYIDQLDVADPKDWGPVA